METPSNLSFPAAFPLMYTQRLLLRQFEEADAFALNRLCHDLPIHEELFSGRFATLAQSQQLIQELQHAFRPDRH